MYDHPLPPDDGRRAYEPLPVEERVVRKRAEMDRWDDNGMKTSDEGVPPWWRRLRAWWARGSDCNPERAGAGWLKPVAPPRPTAEPPGPPPRGLPPKPPLMIELKSDRNALTEIELVAVRLAERTISARLTTAI